LSTVNAAHEVPEQARIALVGLPGSGKTTIGRQLARRLSLDYFDSDHVIEQQLGCSIRTYFEHEGEDRFRELESAVLDELTQKSGAVISTGGGAVLREVNRQRLHERCQVVYLNSHPDELFRRLRHDVTRLRDLHAVRDPLYRATAHFIIETGRPSVGALVNMIVMQIELSGAAPRR
jgi:shikimate kinase